MTRRKEISVLASPLWVVMFLAIAVPASFVPFLAGFALGLSVESDFVFGFYALISGIFADFMIRRRFGTLLVLLRRPRVPFIFFWVLLCIYTMLFKPYVSTAGRMAGYE